MQHNGCSKEVSFGAGHFSVDFFFLRNFRLSLVTRLLHFQSYPKLNESIDRSMAYELASIGLDPPLRLIYHRATAKNISGSRSGAGTFMFLGVRFHVPPGNGRARGALAQA